METPTLFPPSLEQGLSQGARASVLYLLPVEGPQGGAAATGGGLGSPCRGGFQLLDNLAFQLYMVSCAALGRAPATRRSFRAGTGIPSRGSCLLWLRVCVLWEKATVPAGGTPWNSWRCCGGVMRQTVRWQLAGQVGPSGSRSPRCH